ncbi:MAG TPA: ribosome maturation factor RimP [Polyangiaceae bacterium]|jgi:ribosome maturation factor RimP|nr:ribosome maturation factor RimP [Polyangiaceae bacterium]
MKLAYESLKGLDRDRVISVVTPVLQAHGVDVVELIWRSDQRGWVLYLTIERPDSKDPSLGITLDLCADISRDLSAALDVSDTISARYRLEVGSPGVERTLYEHRDYERFAGKLAKVKVREPIGGQHVLRGELKGLDGEGRVVLDVDGQEHHLEPAQIESGRLWFDWQAARGGPNTAKGRQKPGQARRPAQRDR